MLRFAPPFHVSRVIVTSPCDLVTVTLLLSCVMRDRRTRLVGFILVPVPVRSMRHFHSLSPSGHFHSHTTLVRRIHNLSGSTAPPFLLLNPSRPIFPFPSSLCLLMFTLPKPYINLFPFAYFSPARPLVPSSNPSSPLLYLRRNPSLFILPSHPYVRTSPCDPEASSLSVPDIWTSSPTPPFDD